MSQELNLTRALNTCGTNRRNGGTLEYKAGYRSVALINQDSGDMLLTERLKEAQISNINGISRQVLKSELLYRQMLLINIIAENASWLVGVEFNAPLDTI